MGRGCADAARADAACFDGAKIVCEGEGVSGINWIIGTLLIAAIAGVLGTLVWVVGGSYVIAYLATFPPRRRLKRTPEQFGAAYEDIVFASRDGKLLSGWFVPNSRPQGVVVLCHGMMANRAEMLPWAKTLWNSGFSLLMFDFQGTSLSEGDRCTAGCYEPQDLRGAVDYLQGRADCHALPVGVFGFSMGGAAGQRQPPPAAGSQQAQREYGAGEYNNRGAHAASGRGAGQRHNK